MGFVISQNSYNLNKNIIYTDDPYTKVTDSQGNIIRYNNSDALAQALKIWMVSGKGEKVRSNTSGPLISHLGKAITNDRAEKIRGDILKFLSTDFTPEMVITKLDVVGNTKNNQWVINLQGYTKSLESGVNTYVVVNNGS